MQEAKAKECTGATLKDELQIIADKTVSEDDKEPPREEASVSQENDFSRKLKQSELRLREKEIDLKQDELEDRRQDREERKKFANRIFYFISIYMIVLGGIICASGAEHIPLDIGYLSFTLSDSLLITLATTTTVNVIGIFIVVAKYLFPTRRK